MRAERSFICGISGISERNYWNLWFMKGIRQEVFTAEVRRGIHRVSRRYDFEALCFNEDAELYTTQFYGYISENKILLYKTIQYRVSSIQYRVSRSSIQYRVSSIQHPASVSSRLLIPVNGIFHKLLKRKVDFVFRIFF